ncbi:glycosyltransferase family 4 protein [archaeon]|nr:glycosyltransferase family 4 protein [archaeon]
MKILQICNHFYPCVGGIESVVEDLCKNLIELGHQSDVACLNTCAYTKERLPALEEYQKIKIHRLLYFNLKFYKPSFGVFKLLKEYDLIHVHGIGFFSDFVAITKPIHKKPMVLNTHGGVFHTKKLRLLKKLYFIWNRFSLGAFEKVIADSRSDEATFSRICSGIEHIPNGISVDEFQVKRRPEPFTLLYIGRISRNKRIDLLIETVAVLKKSQPGVKLNVVGEDWEGIQKELEELALKKGLGKNIEFLGKIDRREVVEHISKAAFFVSASQYEGFGISVLEAMSAGCPVVLNDIPAFREFVNHGENGFLVDFSDCESTAALLFDLMEKDVSGISKEAVQTAARYDWKNVVEKIERVYEEAIKEGP